MDRVWPNDKTTKQPITNPDRIAATNFVVKLQRACAKLSTQFVDYRSDTGSWVFNVEHFSKYALVDSDDDDDENIVERSIESKTLPKSILQKPKTTKSTENVSPKQNVRINNRLSFLLNCNYYIFIVVYSYSTLIYLNRL